MADNIYLLETRLSRAQQAALEQIREVARSNGVTLFLVGGAVRDLISGTAVRDLDVAVQGDARNLRRQLEKAGGVVSGESEFWQTLFLSFPGGVRMEVGSILSVTYPKPGKPAVAPATVLEDLRRRDFTANAMALSLNEGSYGLLMDPLNGVADIENRQLRLVSNYGFVESPVLLLRAARFMGRLGWTLEEKTQARYETSKQENYIAALNSYHRGYEVEELFHEEDPLRVMRRLEEEGWLKYLSPALSPSKANAVEIGRLHDVLAQLQIQGITPDPAALNFPLVTAKLTSDEVQALKKSFPRQGFVREIESIEAAGKEFVSQLSSKAAALPSYAYKLIRRSVPEIVLWAAFYSKNAGVQAKFKSFSAEWPEARQRIPYTVMLEMRITPDLPGYDDLLEQIFYELMDGKLESAEAIKAFLDPFSPPAPPPPVSLRRPRASKKESKPSRSRKKTQAAEPEVEDEAAEEQVPSAPSPQPEQPAAAKSAPAVASPPVAESPKVSAPTDDPASPEVAAAKPTVLSKKSSGPVTKPASKAAPAKVTVETKPAPKAVQEKLAKPKAKAIPSKSTPKQAGVPKPTAAKPAAPAKRVLEKSKPVVKKPLAPAKSAATKSQPQKAAGNSSSKKTPTPAKKTASKRAKPTAKKAPAKQAKQPSKPVSKKSR